MAGQDPTPALPAGVLTPEVAAALGDGLVVEELTHNAGNQATGGIWPVAGPAGRAVCKLVTAAGGGDPAWATSDDPHHWNAWNREALAYRSGFAAGVYADAGLGAPRLLAMAQALPQTTCHLDVWPMNLIARGGPGGRGRPARLGVLWVGGGRRGRRQPDPRLGRRRPDRPALLPEIEAAVTGGYLAGLRAGGWRGQDGQVRRAIAVTGAAKYCWLAPRVLQGLAGGARPGFYDRRAGEQVLRGRLGVLALVAGWGGQALADPG
jgi:hypothetical protein